MFVQKRAVKVESSLEGFALSITKEPDELALRIPLSLAARGAMRRLRLTLTVALRK